MNSKQMVDGEEGEAAAYKLARSKVEIEFQNVELVARLHFSTTLMHRLAILCCFLIPIVQQLTAATVATPKLNPASGATFASSLTVSASTTTSGATVRYTTNGSDPTSSSSTTAPTLTATATVKARAFKSGMADSAVASGTYTKLTLTPVATPTLSPASGATFASSLTVSASTTTSGATVRYTTNGSDPTSGSTTTAPTLTATATVKARAFKSGMADSAVATGTYTQIVGVVLWLHGMNSDPDTWKTAAVDDRDYWPNDRTPIIAPIILSGKVEGNQIARKDKKGIYHFRLKFGSKDTREGVEKTKAKDQKGQGSGDFSSFEDLGLEVLDAVTCIRGTYPTAQVQIMLVGHSRGGIAARAFLQRPEPSSEKASIVAVVTTGTPHTGSPLGRIYKYLESTLKNGKRPSPQGADWDLVDWFIDPPLWFRGVDVRRPTIDDFTVDSSTLATFTQNAANIPRVVKFGIQQYDGVSLGKLSTGAQNIFGSDSQGEHPGRLSITASNWICDGLTIVQLKGDGIVPVGNQNFSSPRLQITPKLNSSGKILHTDEPKQKGDLRSLMELLVDWWK